MKKTYKPGWRSKKSRGGGNKSYRFIVSNLKILLPFGIILVMAMVFVWPKIANFIEERGKPQTMERILKTNPHLENKVINPKLESVDNKGRPFLVQAEYALHVTPEKTDFVFPSGHMKLEDGSQLSFDSEIGSYYKEQNMLELEENVHVKTDKGYDLTTRYMKLFPKENRGEGNEPVHGTGPNGETIDAEGFRITDKGDIIDFLGRTKISLPGTS